MNPEQQNPNPDKPVDPVDHLSSPQPGPVQPVAPQMPTKGVARDKAWKKLKAAAILLIISGVIGIILTPIAINTYTSQGSQIQQLSLVLGFVTGLYSLLLLFIGIRLLNREWAMRTLTPVGKRIFISLLVILSMFFIVQPSKFISLVSAVLLIFAINDLRKGGIIQR